MLEEQPPGRHQVSVVIQAVKMQLRYALLLLGLCSAFPARAGLLEDTEARNQIKQLEARITNLEAALKKQDDVLKQHTKSMLDLQSQIDALNAEIRKLNGQNEEFTHNQQDADKRQKDFYVDLDTRLRRLESAAATAAKTPAPDSSASAVPAVFDPSDPGPENRAIESAYGLFKAGKYADAIKAFQDFIRKFPDSVHVPNAEYWTGSAQFALKDYHSAYSTYKSMFTDFPDAPKASDALFGMAECHRELKQSISARKVLKQVVTQYPGSDAAAKAKKLLSAK